MVNVILKAMYYALYAVEGVLFARVILSWVRLDSNNKLIQLVHNLSEPFLAPIRSLVEHSIFGSKKGAMLLDISPLIAFILIQAVQSFLISIMKTL